MAKAPDKGLNPAKLAAMVEPLTVRIEKIMGGMSSQVDLPPTSDGDSTGQGWKRDDVLKVEKWLTGQPMAAGAYIGKLTDAGNNLYEYTFVIKQGAPNIAPVFQGAPAQPPINDGMTPGVVWASAGAPAQAWPGQGWGAAGPGNMTPIQQPPQQGYQPWMSQGGYNPNDNRVEQLQRQLEADRLARLQADAQHERERADARHAAEMAAMNQRLEALTQTIAQTQAAKPVEDPRLAALEQQNRDLREAQQRAEDRRQHEAQLAAIQAATQQQFQALQAQIAANNQPRQDPMLPVITLVQATMTQQAAIMQEASRNQLAANDKNLQFMRESQSANAGIMGQVGQAFNMVVDGARKAMDMANEARGGGGGTAEMVADGLKFFGAEGAEIVKRWTNNAEKREAIKAQKEVTLKQLELQAQLARQGVTGPAQQQQQAQPAAGAGLNGAAQPAPTGPVADAPPATVTKLASVPSPQDVSDEKHFKHALVLKAVRDLRAAVAARKIKDPSVVAQMVIIAVGKVGQAGLEVPAFELLKRGEFDELFELLLPSTAPSFRDECAAILAQMITAPAGIASAKAPEPEEADDDDDEAEEEEDDDADEEEEDESEQAPA